MPVFSAETGIEKILQKKVFLINSELSTKGAGKSIYRFADLITKA